MDFTIDLLFEKIGKEEWVCKLNKNRYKECIDCFKIEGEIGSKVYLCGNYGRTIINEWILTNSPQYFFPFEGQETNLPICALFNEIIWLKSDREIKGTAFTKMLPYNKLHFYLGQPHIRTNNKGEQLSIHANTINYI